MFGFLGCHTTTCGEFMFEEEEGCCGVVVLTGVVLFGVVVGVDEVVVFLEGGGVVEVVFAGLGVEIVFGKFLVIFELDAL